MAFQNSTSVNPLGLVIAVFLATVISGLLIWLLGTFGIGVQVSGPVPAFLAGLLISVTGGGVSWLLSLRDIKLGAGTRGAILNTLLGVVMLMAGEKFIPGLAVAGFSGALLASTLMFIISWLASLPLKRINQAAAAKEGKEDP